MRSSRIAGALLALGCLASSAMSQENSFLRFDVSGTFLNWPNGQSPAHLSGWFVVNEDNGKLVAADLFHGKTELSGGLISSQGPANSFWFWVSDAANDVLSMEIVAPGNDGSLAGYMGGPLCSASFGIGTECGYSDSSFFDGQISGYYGVDQVYVGSVNKPRRVPTVRIMLKRHGQGPAPIDPRSHSLGTIAILSDRQFDAVTGVNTLSLTFGPTGMERSITSCERDGRDVNNDGFPDLICHFNPRLTEFLPSESLGILLGKTVQGSPFVGTEKVIVRPDQSDK
jgi:hypothetical protein